MSTPFGDITKLILMELKDSQLVLINKEIAKEYMSDLIITAGTVDFDICVKDLNQYTPYTEWHKTANINLDVTTYSTILTTPPPTNAKIYVYINDIEIDSSYYTYNSTTKQVTVNKSISANSVIDVGWSFEGEFLVDLTHKEKYIVALCAYKMYLQQFIKSEDLLRVQIGDKDYKMSSNWQTLNTLLSLDERVYQRISELKYKYLYDNTVVEDYE